MPKKIQVILNATAGTANSNSDTDAIEKLLMDAGLEVTIRLFDSGDDLEELIEAALATSPECIVAGGGDGTINAVASAITGTEIKLGILPLGTLNHFARDIGIPQKLEEAVEILAAGHTAKVDIGEVNGQYFLNNSSIGLYAKMVRHRELQQRITGRGKWFAAFRAMLAVLKRKPFMDVRLGLEGKRIARRVPLVFIGNNEYIMEGFEIGERDTLNAGMLSIYIPRYTGRMGLLRLATSALLKRLSEQSDFESHQVREVAIETKRGKLHVARDGEVSVMNTPLHYCIHPGALTVIVPKEEANAEL